MTVLAGDLVTNTRDSIPDPVFTGAVPQPDLDGGLFRASTLYRWLDAGVRVMAQACGAVIEDWTALPQVAAQPWYPVDAKFHTIFDGFSNQWRLDTLTVVEGDLIWPTKSLTTAQSLWGYLRKVSDHLEFGLWPVPNVTDPATTLSGAIAAAGVDPIVVAATTGFLPFGYVQIDAEILQYQRLTTGPAGLGTISRGVCGTTAAAHLIGATVQHLGLWLKGTRSPATVTASASVVELPDDITPHLETYLLGRCRRAENEHQEARALMQEFDQVCARLRGDPTRKESQGQIPAWGVPKLGPLYWRGSMIVPALLLSLPLFQGLGSWVG